MNAKWINPAPPETEAGRKGFFNLEPVLYPIKDEDIADEMEDTCLGHLYLWNKECWVRGCDEGILGMLEYEENKSDFVKRGLLASDIKELYKSTKP